LKPIVIFVGHELDGSATAEPDIIFLHDIISKYFQEFDCRLGRL
jgi:hypothetical protein